MTPSWSDFPSISRQYGSVGAGRVANTLSRKAAKLNKTKVLGTVTSGKIRTVARVINGVSRAFAALRQGVVTLRSPLKLSSGVSRRIRSISLPALPSLALPSIDLSAFKTQAPAPRLASPNTDPGPKPTAFDKYPDEVLWKHIDELAGDLRGLSSEELEALAAADSNLLKRVLDSAAQQPLKVIVSIQSDLLRVHEILAPVTDSSDLKATTKSFVRSVRKKAMAYASESNAKIDELNQHDRIAADSYDKISALVMTWAGQMLGEMLGQAELALD